MNETLLDSTIQATITDSIRITPDSTDEVRQITLKIDDPAFRYAEGQSIGVVIPGPHPVGNLPHVRRYTIADDKGMDAEGSSNFEILVRRCHYIDDFNGEKYPGIASNYLCDANPGKTIQLNGPYKSPFRMPSNSTDNILMIGTGTGIAPFRAFIQNIFQQKGQWQGKVRLFFGAKSGMDTLYMNDQNKDLALYFDEKTFQAFYGIATRPLSSENDGLDESIEHNAREIWSMVQKSNTYIYLAGLKDVSLKFDEKMAVQAGSEESWNELKDKLRQEGRFSELLYT